MEYDGKFFIGKDYDLKSKKLLDQLTLYDPDDLTTHGVVVGMTGSGKTGLCIDILEEAALNGIPALLIDPKGDVANILLHFPNQTAEEFQPWVDTAKSRREGKTVNQAAAEVAKLWKEGLASWGIGADRVDRVRDAVDYAVYTPGSDAGLSVSIMASLQAPHIPWKENREALREKISSTATALLGLVGLEADPVRSRDHILLSNIFEHAWQRGVDLDLPELIRQIQNPPMDKLGALELDQFYPTDDRFGLAMSLNNLLASPSFQAWIEGEALNIDSLLWTGDGKPRHSVFYLGHLPEGERIFFVTLLLTAVEAWMHSQGGSSTLRALICFDEVFGFLPPVAIPSSKPPMLRLLKQARAFGLGLLLATQNPVDLDYKALSNAGTWFIGKLQTEQDKARLLDGLESVEGGFNRAQVDKSISSLDKRVFLLHNVHEKGPQVFQTRWAMAYLRGPITRSQLHDLNALVGAKEASTSEAIQPNEAMKTSEDSALLAKEIGEGVSTTKPTVPIGMDEVFLPNDITIAQSLKAAGSQATGVKGLGITYRPVLLAHATVRYRDRKIGLDHEGTVTVVCIDPDPRGVVHWEDRLSASITRETLDPRPAQEARFADLMAPLIDQKTMKALKTDFLDYIYHSAELRIPSNPSLKLFGQPEITNAEFHAQCSEAARESRDAEVEKLNGKYEKEVKRLRAKLTKEERELAEDQEELSSRKMEELATHAENVLGLFSGSRSKRKVSSSLTKRRMTAKAKADVEESLDVIEEFKKELDDIEQEMIEKLHDIDERWGGIAGEIEEISITPFKKNIHLELFGVAWFPYWLVQDGNEIYEIEGYGG